MQCVGRSRASLALTIWEDLSKYQYHLQFEMILSTLNNSMPRCAASRLCGEASALVENHDKIRALSLAHLNVAGAQRSSRAAANHIDTAGNAGYCLSIAGAEKLCLAV